MRPLQAFSKRSRVDQSETAVVRRFPGDAAAGSNADALRQLPPRQRIVSFPYVVRPDHIPLLADGVRASGLLSLFEHRVS